MQTRILVSNQKYVVFLCVIVVDEDRQFQDIWVWSKSEISRDFHSLDYSVRMIFFLQNYTIFVSLGISSVRMEFFSMLFSNVFV